MSKQEDRKKRRASKRAKKVEKQRARQIKTAIEPTVSRIPKIVVDLDNDNNNTVLWSFVCFDPHDWRLSANVEHASFCEIAGRLREYSTRTWGEILADPKRDHPCELASLDPEAQSRLKQLAMDDADELWRFRFDGTQRIWGFRSGAYFVALWWDPDYQVYPVEKKNT